MLRTNLSTRPFYNERGVRALLGIAALLLLLLMAFNVLQFVSLRAREQDLSVRATEASAEAERLRGAAQRVRTQVDPREMAAVGAAADEVNGLIAQRVFSWVRLFTHLENTLPADVRIASIEPRIEDGAIAVTMNIEARSYDALSAFIEALEERGGFHNVLPPVTSEATDGLIDATLEGMYQPPDAATAGQARGSRAAGQGEGQ